MSAFEDFDHNAVETRARSASLYAELHRRCPVIHSDRWGGFFAAAKHATLRRVGGDPATFASGHGVMIPPMGNGRALVPMEADGEQHTAYRAILLPHFGPKTIAELEPTVRRIAEEILDELVPRGHADLYEEYAKRVPAATITRLLGIEYDPDFWEWTETLIYGRLEGDGADRTARAAESLYAFFGEVLVQRLASEGGPGDDFVGVLVRAHAEGALSRDEVVDLSFFLLIAGLDNTAWAIRAALWHLAAHPQDRERLLQDRELVRPAIEECLRMYAPVPALARYVTTPTEVDGAELEPGDRLLLLFAAANRDPTMFDDPNEFRLDRRSNPHLGFGVGLHRCLGSHLARLEIKVSIETALDRIPHYVLVEPETTGWFPAGPLRVGWATAAG